MNRNIATYRFFFIVIILFFTISCVDDNLNDGVVPESSSETSQAMLYAYSGIDTKTSLVNGSDVHWNVGDQIKLSVVPYWSGNSYMDNLRYNFNFIAQKTGKQTYFTYSQTIKIPYGNWYSSGAMTTVQWQTDKAYVLYPSDAEYSPDEGVDYISFTLPSSQTASSGNFDPSANFSVGYVDLNKVSPGNAQEYLNLDNIPSALFNNACGLIGVTLPSNAPENLNSLTVSSVNGTALAGKGTFTNPSKEKIDEVYSVDLSNRSTIESSSSSIILTPEEGTFIPGETYYIVVWPNTHSSGLDFTFSDGTNTYFDKKITSSISVERAKITPVNISSKLYAPLQVSFVDSNYATLDFSELTTTQIKVKVLPLSQIDDISVTCTSSDESAVTINLVEDNAGNGTGIYTFDVTSVNAGTANLTMTFNNGGTNYNIESVATVSLRSYVVNTQEQWRLSTTPNPDSSLYDGVYESFSNHGVNASVAVMKITINGYTNFKLYIRSYAESNWDYAMASNLDQDIVYGMKYNTPGIKAHTRGNQQSGTSISNYTLVEYSNIDGGEHTISIAFTKDGSGASGDDRAYLLIPKNQ